MIIGSEIDFVVTWVDGNDEELNQRRLGYLAAQSPNSKRPQRRGSTRYANNNEIIYCLASILKNAPFARRVFVVTDNQTPPLDQLIKLGFTKTQISKISIIDHKVLMGPELEKYWPLFNSNAIETLIHRIPGLADHYIYLNDDFFIVNTTRETDYFTEEKKPIIRASIRPYASGLQTFVPWYPKLRKMFIKPKASFTNANRNAASFCGPSLFYLQLSHTPFPIYRPFVEEFYGANKAALTSNLEYRFRHSENFNPQALALCLAIKHKSFQFSPRKQDSFILSAKNMKFFLAAHQKHENYRHGLFNRANYLFLCAQSLDMVGPDSADKALSIIENLTAPSKQALDHTSSP